MPATCLAVVRQSFHLLRLVVVVMLGVLQASSSSSAADPLPLVVSSGMQRCCLFVWIFPPRLLFLWLLVVLRI